MGTMTRSGTTQAAFPKTLPRRLGLFDATTIVAGSMIGSGIFITSAKISQEVRSASLLVLVWVFTALVTVAGAWSYGKLAMAFPKAGGQYVFLREAWGDLGGFLYGWAVLLVIQTGTIAAVAVAFAKYLGVLLPASRSSVSCRSASSPAASSATSPGRCRRLRISRSPSSGPSRWPRSALSSRPTPGTT